jgi:hypothetical protein
MKTQLTREICTEAINDIASTGKTKRLLPLTESEQQTLIHYSTFDPAQMLNQRVITLQELDQYIVNLENLRSKVNDRIYLAVTEKSNLVPFSS